MQISYADFAARVKVRITAGWTDADLRVVDVIREVGLQDLEHAVELQP